MRLESAAVEPRAPNPVRKTRRENQELLLKKNPFSEKDWLAISS